MWRYVSLVAICASMGFVMLTSPSALGAPAPRVQVASGTLSGVQRGNVSAFLGIPYAAPPIGALRWRAPRSVASWSGVRAADRFGPSCYQVVAPKGFGPWVREYVVQGSVSEDCLFLNVWTSQPHAGARMPVLVWIHGGGFIQGSGSVAIYDGTALASRGIVVVSINYRLGAFGFLAHPELTREAAAADSPPGNYGLQDMIAALRWVRENIDALGGDPHAVTIAGQSAGAIAVQALVASPSAVGLFQRAIAESGLPGTLPATSLQAAEHAGDEFAQSKGATSLAALRALPPEQLVSASLQTGPRFAPIVDGKLLPDSPGALAASGRVADTPFLVGMVADETSAFGPVYGTNDPAQFAALVAKSYGALASRFAPLYPASSDEQRLESSRQILRDRGLAALYAWSTQRVAHTQSPVYAYMFSHVEPGPDAARYQAFHSSEIPYVFDTLDQAPERGFTDADRELARRLSTYWINFVRTGDPNGPSLTVWPGFSATEPRILELGDPIVARPVFPAGKFEAVKIYLDQGGTPSIF